MATQKSSAFVTIPKRSIWSLLGLLLLLGFTYLQFKWYIIPEVVKYFQNPASRTTVQSIGSIWAPIVAYGLIMTNILFVVNIFKKLDNVEWLISYLLVSLFKGLTIGLAVGYFVGIISGSFYGLHVGIDSALTAIFTIGTFFALYFGLMFPVFIEKKYD